MNLKQLLMLLGLVRPEKILYIGGSDILPPPLPPEEERALIARLAEGDEQARQTLIERNLRLVVYIARRFENIGVNIEDLISIGTIGLIKAVGTFRADRNIKLATYSSRCIENEILMYIRKISGRKAEVSLDEPINTDWDGNELLLSDVLGTDSDVVMRPMEDDVDHALLRHCLLYTSQAGDLIELYINDEFFPPEGAKTVQKAAPKKKQNQPKVNVIYEDENIAVLYKPTHLLCHSDRTGDANLVDAFTQYLAEKGEYDPHGENRFKPGICNRLDRGTEGLVIAAKSYTALRDMNEIIRTDLLKKEYYTITVGIPQSGRFTAWWEHDEKNNKVSIHAHQSQDERRKQIITDVDVLRTAGPFALCKIGLVTGRTHQIRAHLAYLGKPVLGDIKYGNRKMNERTGTKTQALCAVRISFLDVPEENTLHYLSGKVIKLKDPQILQQFDALDKNKEA